MQTLAFLTLLPLKEHIRPSFVSFVLALVVSPLQSVPHVSIFRVLFPFARDLLLLVAVFSILSVLVFEEIPTVRLLLLSFVSVFDLLVD